MTSDAKARTRIVALVGRLGAALALVFVAVTLARSISSVPPVAWSLRLGVFVVVGVVANVAVVVLSSLSWRVLLRGAGASLSVQRAFVICGKSQIAKYLPGNVFHFVGRAALAVKEAIPLPVAIASITLETLFIVVVGALVAAPLLIARWAEIVTLVDPSMLWVWPALVVVLAVVVGLLWRRHGARVKEGIAAALGIASASIIATVALYDVAMFGILGGSLYLIGDAAWPGAMSISPLHFIFAYALAWVVGFVVPGAPGGVGIREGVFLLVLGGPVGGGLAASLAIVSRLQSIVGDVVTFAVASVVERHPHLRQPPL